MNQIITLDPTTHTIEVSINSISIKPTARIDMDFASPLNALLVMTSVAAEAARSVPSEKDSANGQSEVVLSQEEQAFGAAPAAPLAAGEL